MAVAEDMMCDMFEAAGERPAERQLCELDDCPFWQASQFGEVIHHNCSARGMVYREPMYL